MTKVKPGNGDVPVTMALPLETIASKIRTEHDACKRDAQSAVEHAVEAGKLLTQAKARVEHGGWGQWVETNFPATQQTANTYMRIFENYGRSRDLPVSVNAALKQITSASKFWCPGCNKMRSASQFPPKSDRCKACWKPAPVNNNGSESAVYVITTERQQQLADKAKKRVGNIVYGSPRVERLKSFPVNRAVAAVGEDREEIDDWIKQCDEAAAAYRYLADEIRKAAG